MNVLTVRVGFSGGERQEDVEMILHSDVQTFKSAMKVFFSDLVMRTWMKTKKKFRLLGFEIYVSCFRESQSVFDIWPWHLTCLDNMLGARRFFVIPMSCICLHMSR
jgi:hypothetical protein